MVAEENCWNTVGGGKTVGRAENCRNTVGGMLSGGGGGKHCSRKIVRRTVGKESGK